VISANNPKDSIYFDEIDSTNVYAIDLLSKTNPPHGFCIFTDFQTAGKGQIGRSWHSLKGKNILASWILHFNDFLIEDQFLLSMAISLSISDVLRKFHLPAIVKWPNDIFIGNEKIAGILIQNMIRGNLIKSSVVGCGLNVNQLEFPAGIGNPTSLAILTGQKWNRKELLGECTQSILDRTHNLAKSSWQVLKTEYLQRMFLFGEWHDFTLDDGTILHAKIIDVSDSGQLIVLDKTGRKLSFGIKQIAY
jgi:BirA family biotin operon repressor/biotin-[acetyl-CoA-carboxylase] ligase